MRGIFIFALFFAIPSAATCQVFYSVEECDAYSRDIYRQIVENSRDIYNCVFSGETSWGERQSCSAGHPYRLYTERLSAYVQCEPYEVRECELRLARFNVDETCKAMRAELQSKAEALGEDSVLNNLKEAINGEENEKRKVVHYENGFARSRREAVAAENILGEARYLTTKELGLKNNATNEALKALFPSWNRQSSSTMDGEDKHNIAKYARKLARPLLSNNPGIRKIQENLLGNIIKKHQASATSLRSALSKIDELTASHIRNSTERSAYFTQVESWITQSSLPSNAPADNICGGCPAPGVEIDGRVCYADGIYPPGSNVTCMNGYRTQ